MPREEPPAPTPQLWLSSEEPPAPPKRRLRNRLIVLGVVVSVAAAFGAVAAGAFSRAATVHTAFSSLLGSPTLKVVFSAETADVQEQATLAQYSVALTVTSENGSQPLSGSDGLDNFEISVFRSGTDLGDLLVADGAVYGRLNLQAISPSAFQRATQSIDNDLVPGPANAFAQASIGDEWVGVDDSTIASTVAGLGVKLKSSGPGIDTYRNAAAMSFAQSWDTWATIHEVSSSGGSTEYSLEMPVRSFVASFTQHLASALAKDVPSLARDLGSSSLLVKAIPASLTIPMTMWVTNGALSQLDITYKGDSLDMAISHPSVAVTAPAGADMITPSIVTSLESGFGLCPGGSAVPPSTGAGTSVCDCASAESSDNGGGFCLGLIPELNVIGLETGLLGCATPVGAAGSSGGLTGLSGVSEPTGWTGYAPLCVSASGSAVTSSTFSATASASGQSPG
jgi:hypothetical protein